MSKSPEATLPALIKAINGKKPISLIQADKKSETSEVNDAAFVKIDKEIVDINSPTDYKVSDAALSLKDVIFCWLNKDKPSSKYIEAAESAKVTSLTFGQRTKLISFLSAPADSAGASTTDEPSAKRQQLDPVYVKVKSHEREVANDYRAQDDFSYLIKLSQVKIVEQLKQKPSHSSGSSASKSSISTSGSTGSSHQDRMKDPIIILSPAASSILNLSNISAFLQDSVFEPPTISTNSNGVVKIKKNTKFGPVSFLLIDNTDKFFNKPDYWKRVVAIFTTGQKWQFKNYQISNPSELFRSYPGFYINYGEPVPKHVKEWGNVNVLSIDKSKRFRDRQVVESFWNTVERFMTYKGYGVKK